MPKLVAKGELGFARDPLMLCRIARTAVSATLVVAMGAVMTLVCIPNASAALVTTLKASADTTVNSQQPSTNYGSALTQYGSPSTYKTFLRFPTAQIDDDAVITSAKLRVYGSTTSTSRWEVRTAPGGWSEATATYENQPQWNSTFLGRSATGAQAGLWNEIQLPVSAVSKTASTKLGVRGTVSGSRLAFQSRETTNDPQLVLTYATPPTPTETATPPPPHRSRNRHR